MTRINAGIDPAELPDKLLLAEHREITRIPNAVRSRGDRLSPPAERFTLGAGHVRFFYDKLQYLECRYLALYQECVYREFIVTDKRTAFNRSGILARYFGDYEPTAMDRRIVVERIESKGFRLLLV